MEVITIENLQIQAKKAAQGGVRWHFHLLTPTCKLNKSSDFALVLEAAGENYVHYCEKPPKTVSKKLAKLLHGVKTFDKPASKEPQNSPTAFKNLLNRAEQLSIHGTAWHHHMLFPGCIFNQQGGRWVIMLEDPIQPEPMGCVFEEEPKEDIKLLEQLFYAQQKLT